MDGPLSRGERRAPSGPLSGVRVLEFSGIGPGPFCGMLLSDLGADVLRVDRPDARDATRDVTFRGRRSVVLDLKHEAGMALCLELVAKADVLIEGFRPGVMERLGLGPDRALEINPRLVYGRMTGWGQDGPLAQAAGHDINYIALTGALAAMGPADGPPVPPLNLVGDFGGGALYLAFGITAALYEAQRSGQGQVVDAAIVDGAASLMAMTSRLRAEGMPYERGRALLDGSAHFYRTYECADGLYLAVGAIEPQFYAEFLERCGLKDSDLWPQAGPDGWPAAAARLAATFKTRPRAHWLALLEGTDACVSPVLAYGEAPDHPHMAARGVFVEVDGIVQPAPAPRLSRTPGRIQAAPPAVGEGEAEALADWGVEVRR